MIHVETISANDKPSFYTALHRQLVSLLADEHDMIANLANTSALLFHALDRINWAGFYILRQNELVLAPFQGKPACVRIPVGRGVCGTAVERRETILVENVHEFPGHIACDADSRSEIVIPLIKNSILLGVLDIDSPEYSRFDNDDKIGLEMLVATLSETLGSEA